jgi:hypothetical protein
MGVTREAAHHSSYMIPSADWEPLVIVRVVHMAAGSNLLDVARAPTQKLEISLQCKLRKGNAMRMQGE